MKHLFAFTLAISSLCCLAQWPTLPYNPDDNADGLIGVADLQALLANYGNEFASAVVSEDGESAIVYMGNMGYPHCEYACENLPGFWTMPKLRDLIPVWSEVYGNQIGRTWLHINYLGNSAIVDLDSPYPFFEGSTNATYAGYVLDQPYPLSSSYKCYCVAKQLPRVEYSYCMVADGVDLNLGAQGSNAAVFQSCCDDKVQNGWYPLGGYSKGHTNDGAQAFWRWAE